MMRAISLWQPWASLMANGSKRDETRNGVTKVRGEVAICASLKWTNDLKILATTEPFASALLGREVKKLADAAEIINATPLGCVVAVGDLYDSIPSEKWLAMYHGYLAAGESQWTREKAFGNYSPGRGVWRFRNMRKLVTPVPVKGAQQWFNLPPAVEAAVRAQL